MADKAQGSGASPKGDGEKGPDVNRLTATGHAIWLMSRSPMHKHLMISDTEWL
jgi:hemolysin-activating ACP:hemolysin acyltransferase